MIKSFRDKDTARVFAGRRAKKIPPDILERAEAKLAILDQAESLSELTQPPPIGCTSWVATVRGNGPSASTCSGASALSSMLRPAMPTVWR
jgi:hypothetical protein